MVEGFQGTLKYASTIFTMRSMRSIFTMIEVIFKNFWCNFKRDSRTRIFLCYYFDWEIYWHNYCAMLNKIIMTLECSVSCNLRWRNIISKLEKSPAHVFFYVGMFSVNRKCILSSPSSKRIKYSCVPILILKIQFPDI